MQNSEDPFAPIYQAPREKKKKAPQILLPNRKYLMQRGSPVRVKMHPVAKKCVVLDKYTLLPLYWYPDKELLKPALDGLFTVFESKGKAQTAIWKSHLTAGVDRHAYLIVAPNELSVSP